MTGFALVASLAVLTPTVVVAVTGERSRSALLTLKHWLVEDLATIVIAVFVILGANAVEQGLSVLS